MKHSTFNRAVVLAAGTLLTWPAFGQATGSIVGTIFDNSGAVVGNVKVTATRVETGMTTSTASNEEGIYRLAPLLAGNYTIRAESPSFKQENVSGIQLQVDQVLRLNMRLSVGNVSETISVSATAQMIRTEEVGLGGVIDNKKVIDLPLNGRNYIQLTQLLAGVNPGLPANPMNNFDQSGASFSANGQRPEGNNFTLDGTTNTGLLNRNATILPSIDAMQEFEVETGQYSAAKGQQAGGQVNVVTKSGTNNFHLVAYEFLRNDNLDANDFFRNSSRVVNPEFKRNQFGAVVSGPVIRNKTFALFNYDGLRLSQPGTATGLVPTPAQLQGNFSGSAAVIVDPATGLPFANNIIPTSRINPAIQKLNQFWPAPNTSQPGYNFINTGSNVQNYDEYLARVDHQFSDKTHLFGRYARQTRTIFTTPLLDFFATTTRRPFTNANVTLEHTFTPSIFNETKFGVSRQAGGRKLPARDPAVFSGTALGIPSATNNPDLVGVPTISVSGFASIGDQASTPSRTGDNLFQYVDNLSITKGRHHFSMGAMYIREQQNQFSEYLSRGTFAFDGFYTTAAGAAIAPVNPLADYILGLPHRISIGSGSAPNYLRANNVGLFVQDDIKVTPQLTINLGLRYEIDGRPTDTHGFPRNFNVLTGQVIGNGTPGEKLVNGDYNDFGPRIGIAWQPFKDGKTVIRTGFGTFYNQVQFNVYTVMSSNPPTYLTSVTTNAPVNPTQISDPVGAGTTGTPSFYIPDENLRTAYTNQWSFNVEHQFASNTSLDVGYVGSSSHKLGRQYDANTATSPGPGAIQPRRRFPQYGSIYDWTGDANASYEALQVQLRKRYSHGVTALVSYAFSKTIDSGSFTTGSGGFAASGSGAPSNPFNRAAEKGVSGFDTPQRFVTSIVYDLPFGKGWHALPRTIAAGWQMSGILTLQSGYPMSTGVVGDPPNVGSVFGGGRPNVLHNPNLPADQQTISRWFDTSAFARPADYTFGNAGRNILRSDGVVNWDLSAMKMFYITEKHIVQFRAEFYNAFNNVVFGAPGASFGSASFGIITSQANTPRQIQFGLKYSF